MNGPIRTTTVVIGAGPAGLATGACLRRAGVSCEILERAATVAATWYRHYERLHLHTDKAHSTLPYLGFPRPAPKFPSRRDVIEYLEAYARQFALSPRFGQEVVSVHHSAGRWYVATHDAAYAARAVVVATSLNSEPHVPCWPGRERYRGVVSHSSQYRNGKPYTGERMLVVGMGNSGAEIAIDLWEHGARPTLAVRGPVNIIPRDLLGLPVLAISAPLSKLPPRLADQLTAPLVRLTIGDLSRVGLRKAHRGPFCQIRETARIPVLDVGTLRLIRQGAVQVRPGIERFTDTGVVFTDGRDEDFHAVILATGYRPNIASFLHEVSVVTSNGVPRSSGRESELPGLYFCGFHVVVTGMFPQIGREAQQIAQDIAAKHS